MSKKKKIYAVFCNNNYSGYALDKKIARKVIEERNFDKNLVWKFYPMKIDEGEFGSKEYHETYCYYYDDVMSKHYMSDDEVSEFIQGVDQYMVNAENIFASDLNGTFHFLRDDDLRDRYYETFNILYALLELMIYSYEDADDKFRNLIENSKERFQEYGDGFNPDELWEEFISNYVIPF